MIIGLREGAEPSNDVPKRVLRYYKQSLPFASDIVQDRYNDDIYQDICCA
jgi:hypothetical protein